MERDLARMLTALDTKTGKREASFLLETLSEQEEDIERRMLRKKLGIAGGCS